MKRRLKAKFLDSNFSIKQLKEQERSLKRQYKTINRLRDQSGFGWDPTRKMVVATEEVWAPILQTDKDAKRWYNKPFPYYDDLQNLYSGCIATGSHHRGSNHYANLENQFHMDSPSPIIPALGGLNHSDFDNDFLIHKYLIRSLLRHKYHPPPKLQMLLTPLPLLELLHLGGQTKIERERPCLNFMRSIWHIRRKRHLCIVLQWRRMQIRVLSVWRSFQLLLQLRHTNNCKILIWLLLYMQVICSLLSLRPVRLSFLPLKKIGRNGSS